MSNVVVAVSALNKELAAAWTVVLSSIALPFVFLTNKWVHMLRFVVDKKDAVPNTWT